ncbi:MAG: hypothetical protein PHI37_05240 [Candidatus Gracilibacteria bacterium]|nr:hypothetical protein [Candidatus Gracilibacteria bacterium]
MLTYNKRLLLTLILLFVIIFISKKYQSDKLEELGITTEQAKNIKNEINSIEEKNKSEKLTDEEINFFEKNGLKKDSNGLYNMRDGKSMIDSNVIIFFKKNEGKWYWSILYGDWNDINNSKYTSTKSVYNGYTIKRSKTKEIFEKLSGKQINNPTSQNTEGVKKEIDVINIVKNESTSNNTKNNDKYGYSLFKNSDGTYTFLGYGAMMNQQEEIKKLAEEKGINGDNLKIERADSDETIYRKNLELSSKNSTKMKDFLSLLKIGGDSKDRDDYFNTIYKYNVSRENLEKYSEQVNEIKEFGNIELIEK